ncbi:MAG: hypothetical protein IH987_22430, partial [Planctomycetes bacterium]|nr:hypothetical protein [Planctomycetota bacterium]
MRVDRAEVSLDTMVPLDSKPGISRRSGWRRFGFRLGAVVVGLLVLVAIELVLIGLDVGRAVDQDPFVGFQEIRPLFVLDETGRRYEIPPSRQTFFRPESFSARKS